MVSIKAEIVPKITEKNAQKIIFGIILCSIATAASSLHLLSFTKVAKLLKPPESANPTTDWQPNNQSKLLENSQYAQDECDAYSRFSQVSKTTVDRNNKVFF